VDAQPHLGDEAQDERGDGVRLPRAGARLEEHGARRAAAPSGRTAWPRAPPGGS
jgi:hypothetical protein